MTLEMSRLRVLIVDDHMLVWQYVRSALHKARISDLTFAENGNEAIELIERAYAVKKPFDIVFLDWNMPEVNGIGVLSHIRKKQEFDNMAVVMLTAEGDLHSVKKAINAGATSYIVKPPSAANLDKKVSEIFDWLKKKRGEVPNVIHDRG